MRKWLGLLVGLLLAMPLGLRANVSVAVTDTHFYCAPWVTYSGSSGTLQANNVMSGASYVQWNNPGSYCVLDWTTSSSVPTATINFDLTPQSGLSSNLYPQIAVVIDGGTQFSCQIASTVAIAGNSVVVGTPSVNTTLNGALSSTGLTSMTVASASNIKIGATLVIDFGTASAENVMVQSTYSSGSTTVPISATVNTHSNGAAVESAIAIASGLNGSGAHTMRITYQCGVEMPPQNTLIMGTALDWWNTPASALRLTGFSLDSGASTTAYTPATKKVLFLGDEILEGYQAYFGTSDSVNYTEILGTIYEGNTSNNLTAPGYNISSSTAQIIVH